MIAILCILLIPIVVHISFGQLSVISPSFERMRQMLTVGVTFLGMAAIIISMPFAEIATGPTESFFSLQLSLFPFRGAMIIYFIFSYGLTVFIKDEEAIVEIDKPISRLVLLICAIGLVLSSNFYTILIFCTGMTISMLVANGREGKTSKGSNLHFYLRKEFSDFFLLVGFLLLSYKQSINNFSTLEQLLDDKDSLLPTISITLVTLWFFIRMRIFPFISLRQSYFKSIGNRLQSLFMSVYLPALILVYYSFSTFIDQLPMMKNLLLTAGAVSVCCYSVLMLFSRRLDSSQTFYVYSYYGLIPLAIGLGAGPVLAFHLIYMSILLASLVYLHTACKMRGLIGIDDLSKLKYISPLHAIMMGFVFIALMGFPLIGLFSLKYEILWTGINDSTPILISAVLWLCHILMTCTTARYLYALILPIEEKKIVMPTNKLQIIFVTLFILFLVILGAMGLPAELGLRENPLRQLFSSGMSDLRIIFLPDWMRYLVIALSQLPIVILILVARFCYKRGFKSTNLGSDKRLIRLLNSYDRIRSGSYGASVFAKNLITDFSKTVLRSFDKNTFFALSPLFLAIEKVSSFFNRNRVRTPHAYFVMILLSLMLYFAGSLIGGLLLGGLK